MHRVVLGFLVSTVRGESRASFRGRDIRQVVSLMSKEKEAPEPILKGKFFFRREIFYCGSRLMNTLESELLMSQIQ